MNLLAQAINTDDLDAALKPIQDALGIEDGGVAGTYFSDVDDWSGLSTAARRVHLTQWIRSELLFCVGKDER